MGSRVGDGCTVQIMDVMRGGGNHRNKWKKAEQNQPRVQKAKNQCEVNKSTMSRKSC